MTTVLNRFRALLTSKKVGRFTLRATKGFTLIELLVVIAIIAVLAAVVLVALGNARVRARDARRVSDLNNVALSMEVYLDTANTATYPDGAAGAVGGPAAGPSRAGFTNILTALRGQAVVKGDIADPLNTSSPAATGHVYQGQTNTSNVNQPTSGKTSGINTSYLLGADLETTSTASCAADYDGWSIGAAIAGGNAPDVLAANTWCVERPTANDCSSSNQPGGVAFPDGALPFDYCICNGPACQ